MKHKIVVWGSGTLMVAAVLVLAAWYFMRRPLYNPGEVRGAAIAAAMPAGDEYWDVGGGLKLYHRAEGAGRNALVVHGGPGVPLHASPPGLKALAERFRMVYYDQRGCGRSTRPFDRFASPNYYGNLKGLERALGLAAQVADIERIRKALGDERLVIVGHSFGALLAALYAAEFPGHVDRMVLAAPAGLLRMPPEDGGLYEQIRGRLPENLKPGFAAYLDRYFDYGHIFTRSEAELQALNAEVGKYYAAAGGMLPEGSGEGGGWMVHAMYFSMGRFHDWRGDMKRVSAPVLVLHGDRDLQPESTSRAFAACFPNARVQVVTGAGHFVFSDRPAEFAAAAGKFLGGS